MGDSGATSPPARAKPPRKLRSAIAALAVLGVAVSGYLTYAHYANVKVKCLAAAPCDPVLTSRYAQVWGVPISLFGVLMYLGLIAAAVQTRRSRSPREYLNALVIYALALSGVIFTVYLYYLEIFVLHAFCTWCIVSSIVIISIFVLSVLNLRRSRRTV